MVKSTTYTFIPLKVKVLGEDWKIKKDNKFCKKKKVKGIVCFDIQTIFIKDGNEYSDRTTLHEFCHIRDYLLGGEHTEREIRLEAMFWRDVLKGLSPIVKRYKKKKVVKVKK